jgi:transposase
MIDFHTYSKIQDLYHREHLSFNKIGKLLSLDPRTVSALAKEIRYKQRKKRKKFSTLNPYKSAIRKEIELTQCTAASIFRSLKNQGYEGGYTIVSDFVSEIKPDSINDKYILPSRWMFKLIQGKINAESLIKEHNVDLTLEDTEKLVSNICEGRLRERNRAVVVIATLKHIPVSTITQFLMMDKRTVEKIIQQYNSKGVNGVFDFRQRILKKHEQSKYKNALFSILHSPPSEYNINRTSWTMRDLHWIMQDQGTALNEDSIRKIIRDAGFTFKKAKKVLTSTDPDYREKLKSITKILRNLGNSECFFSIDEYGPFAIKMRGGLALTDPQKPRAIPQWQKSKGSLILTGALELSSNQITHFYSENKNTAEMIKLLHILINKYENKSRIYFSWDAASWHASKKLEKEVSCINSDGYRIEHNTPFVSLAPLPASSQFLNVIESIFSGMARAIIHNSDYQSVEECKAAIDRYFSERNDYFIKNPKRAGNKIWGKEREKAVFRESNNCKDPMY